MGAARRPSRRPGVRPGLRPGGSSHRAPRPHHPPQPHRAGPLSRRIPPVPQGVRGGRRAGRPVGLRARGRGRARNRAGAGARGGLRPHRLRRGRAGRPGRHSQLVRPAQPRPAHRAGGRHRLPIPRPSGRGAQLRPRPGWLVGRRLVRGARRRSHLRDHWTAGVAVDQRQGDGGGAARRRRRAAHDRGERVAQSRYRSVGSRRDHRAGHGGGDAGGRCARFGRSRAPRDRESQHLVRGAGRGQARRSRGRDQRRQRADLRRGRWRRAEPGSGMPCPASSSAW